MIRILKRTTVIGACLALILAVAPSLSARVPIMGASYLPELERAIYHFTNEVRQRNGAPPLSWENCLRDVARAHSADMLVRHYFAHESPEGSTPHQRITAGCRFPLDMSGENIWMGTGPQPRDIRQLARHVVDNWMSSPGHRANLLRPEFTDMGVGAVANRNEVQVTQVFIRHRQQR